MGVCLFFFFFTWRSQFQPQRPEHMDENQACIQGEDTGAAASGSLDIRVPRGFSVRWAPLLGAVTCPRSPLAAVAHHDSCSIKVRECAAGTGQTSNAHRGGRGQSVRTLRGCPGATWCRGGQPKSAHKGLGIAETLNGVCFTVFTTDLGFHQKRGFLLWGSALVLFCLFFKILGFKKKKKKG